MGKGNGTSLLNRFSLYIVLGCFLIFVVIAYVWMRSRAKSKETFEGNIDSILKAITGDAPNDNYVYNEPTVDTTQREPIPSRMCAIYYTNNVDLCNDSINNWYVRPMNDLRRYRDQLSAMSTRTDAQNAQLDAANRVIADRESGTLPKGVCKVEFPGWVEPKVTPNGEPFPYKNKATLENQNRLYPDDWALCFKSSDTVENAVAQSKQFADEYVVKSFDYAGDYFQDGKIYSKVAFTTIDLADNLPAGAVTRGTRATSINSFVCATQPPPISNVPSTMLIFELTDDLLRSMYVGKYNTKTQTFDQVDDSELIFQGLFEMKMSGRSLYLVPKLVVGSIYQFAFDVCGRMSGNGSVGKEFNLSLVRDLGVQPRLLYSAPSDTSPTLGTLDELKARIADLNGQIDKTNADIAAVNALSTTPKFARGYVRYTYKLNMKNPPNMANAAALDLIFNGTDPITNTPNATIETRQIMTTQASERTYANDETRIKYGYIIEGYINIGTLPSARYYFNINSDDGGDFVIENTVVASHYNYHVMDDTGVRADFRLERNKYYKFRARVTQWMGGSGIALQWKTGLAKTYTDIPSQVFYYDENDTKRYEASLRQKEIASVVSNKALIEQTIDSIEKRRNQYMQIAFQNIANRRLTQWKDYVSVDGRLYVDIGILDGVVGRSDEQALGQVILQEQGVSVLDGVKEYASPVQRFDNVQYSISFWIYVGQVYPKWINIFFHGAHDDWKLINEGDRTPGIWLYPNTARIHFRQRSTVLGNDGVDSYESIPLNRWVHVVGVVNGTNDTIYDQPKQSVQLYVNGQKLKQGPSETNFRQLTNNAVWHWGQQVGKKARIGYNTPTPDPGKGIFVQKLYWYNRVLGSEEVLDIFNNSGILRNRRSECRDVESVTADAYGWKTNSLANMGIQCNKDESLSKISLAGVVGDKAKYDFRCCRMVSDDPINVAAEPTYTITSLLNNGSVNTLAEQNIDCQNKGLQQLSFVANSDRNFAYYNYTCGEYSSSVNMNRKCTTKSTAWADDDGTLKPLTTTPVTCEDHEYIARMQVNQDTTNKKIRYDYSCCEVGGL